MKKIVVSALLAVSLLFSAGAANAIILTSMMHMFDANPLKQLAGYAWIASDNDQKVSMIFGIEYAISMEYAIAELQAQEAGTSTERDAIIKSLSPLAKNWILAFDDGTSRGTIVDEIDAWYEVHEDNLDILVVDVLWKQVLEPRLK